MNIETIFGSALVATIFSSLVSYIIFRHQENLQYITGERKEWREKIRDIASELNDASYKKTLALLVDLKVRINAFGASGLSVKYIDDAHIWELIGEIEEKEISEESLKLQQKQLIGYLALLLKVDWERSKKEVKGDIYEIISYFLFISSGIYFTVSIFWSNQNEEMTSFNLASIVFLYIAMTVLVNVFVVFEVKIMCSSIVTGVVTGQPEQFKWCKLGRCYIIWVISILGLVVTHSLVIKFFFQLIQNIKSDVISIFVESIIYVAGLGFLYVSQTFNIDKEFYYNNGINILRVQDWKKKNK